MCILLEKYPYVKHVHKYFLKWLGVKNKILLGDSGCCRSGFWLLFKLYSPPKLGVFPAAGNSDTKSQTSLESSWFKSVLVFSFVTSITVRSEGFPIWNKKIKNIVQYFLIGPYLCKEWQPSPFPFGLAQIGLFCQMV